MEWPDFHYSPLEETLHGFLSNQFEMEKPSGWTNAENKLFEDALAEIEPDSPAFFENVAIRIPWKSIEEIKNHYEALIDDLKMIETGLFPVPDYKAVDKQEVMEAYKDEVEGSPSNEAKTRNGQQRRRGVPWTEEEHQLFLVGLNKYGKGDWRSISRYYVITKTPTQVASHAQKYFRRQTSSTPVDRRRPSIHDIQTVTTLTSPMPQTQINVDEAISFSSCGLINSMLHNNFNAGIVEQNPMFLPMNPNFPSDDPIFDQTCAGYPGSYLLPSLGNPQWG